MDYTPTLQWLQGLIGSAQSMYGQQFNQGLTAEEQAHEATLAERGRETDAQLALEKVIADWQNQLANRQQGFAEEQGRLQTSLPYQMRQNLFASTTNPETAQAGGNWLTNLLARYNPYSSTYAYGVPRGTDGSNVNPFTGITLTPTGIPIVSMPRPNTFQASQATAR